MNFMLFSMARVYIREQKNTKILSNYLEDFYNEQDMNFILFSMARVYILEQKKYCPTIQRTFTMNRSAKIITLEGH